VFVVVLATLGFEGWLFLGSNILVPFWVLCMGDYLFSVMGIWRIGLFDLVGWVGFVVEGG